jgi:hypothetical protein
MSHRHFRKPVGEDYYKKVRGTIASLTTNFQSLRAHPLLASDDTSSESIASFERVLNRALPATEDEKWISATIQYMANLNRGSFISFMFKNRIASVSQLVDGKLVSIGLGAEELDIYIGEDGLYHVDTSTRAPGGKDRGTRTHANGKRDKGRYPERKDRRAGRDKSGRQGDKKSSPLPKPTMSAEMWNKVLNDLPSPGEADAPAGLPAASSPAASSPAPYRDAVLSGKGAKSSASTRADTRQPEGVPRPQQESSTAVDFKKVKMPSWSDVEDDPVEDEEPAGDKPAAPTAIVKPDVVSKPASVTAAKGNTKDGADKKAKSGAKDRGDSRTDVKAKGPVRTNIKGKGDANAKRDAKGNVNGNPKAEVAKGNVKGSAKPKNDSKAKAEAKGTKIDAKTDAKAEDGARIPQAPSRSSGVDP